MPADALLFSNSRPPGAEVPFAHAAGPLRDHLGHRTVWFVGWARHDLDAYTGWVADALADVLGPVDLRGLHREPDPAATIREADPARETVLVGGGNTFRLRRRTGDNGVLAALRERDDLRYAGASAGSNLACPTIMTTNDMPIVDPGGLDALGRLPVQVNPHYLDPDPHSAHRGETREERIAEFHEENALAVVGLREGAWLFRSGDRLTLDGHTARLFRRGHEPTELAAGTDLSWLLETPTS
ncbi:dipeptidase PepE [Actinomycetospora cinnamomea]|uniref:Alpha-aspartyl dipeptidase n=1 Tax=Actinomycetospora cinnamomea TaxID=663609 RepID=A0A2U1FF54_9PSEU|nr:dipeptidase PepE [Actinomycetospora cinnamomea]PVZ10823.1 alpha-aspartyl dipeptidase [Actinomycetospora cinnamomea]